MKSLNDMAYEFYKAAFKADNTPNLDSAGNPAVNTVVTDQPVSPGSDSGLNTQTVTDGFIYANVTSDGIIKSGSGYIAGYVVTGGAATALTIYDNTAASGTILHKAAAVDGSATSVMVSFPKPIQYRTGLYADIGGASAEVNVLYI